MIAYIFAQHKTNKKVILAAHKESLTEIQKRLGEQLGGSWIYVDKLGPGEVLTFTDGKEYNGFTNAGDRYSDQIIKIK